MLARDYLPIALKYYPTDIREDDSVFLTFLNDARRYTCLKAGIKKQVEFPLIDGIHRYHLPLNQGIISVMLYHSGRWYVLPRKRKDLPYSLSWTGGIEGYYFDPHTYEIVLVGGNPTSQDKLMVEYIVHPVNFMGWEDVEKDIPEHYAELVGIAYARNLAGYDMNYTVMQFLDGLLIRESSLLQIMRS